jgi:hypothetical protein
LPWPDEQTPTFPEKTPTLWVCGDRHQDELRDRAVSFGLPPEAVRLNAPPDNAYSGVDLDDPDNVLLMRRIIENERPAIVFIDTVWRSTRRRMYREDEVNALFNPIIEIAQQTGTAFLGLMHLSKDHETLGRRLEGLARSVLKLTRPDPEGQPDRRKLTCMGNHKEPAPLGLTMHDRGCTFDSNPPEEPTRNVGGRPNVAQDKATRFIRDELATQNDQLWTELRDKWTARGGKKSTFSNAVDALRDGGELTTDGGEGTGKRMVLHFNTEHQSKHE